MRTNLSLRRSARRAILGAASLLLLTAAATAGCGTTSGTASAPTGGADPAGASRTTPATPPSVDEADPVATIDTVDRVATFEPAGNVIGGDLAVAGHTTYVTTTTLAESGNTGQVVTVGPRGRVRDFGPGIRLGTGRLHGIALDAEGQVYVASASYGTARNRILRVSEDQAVVVATTGGSRTSYSAPNGLAFDGEDLYVTDPYAAAVWRFVPGDEVLRLTEPWLEDPLLASETAGWLGVNGIAFGQDTLYLTNTDRGILAAVDLRSTGRPAKPRVVAELPELVGADGITVDDQGLVWVAVAGPLQPGDVVYPLTGQYVLALDQDGDVHSRTHDADWMDSPNAVAPARPAGTLLLLNGSQYAHEAELVSFVGY
ncbi:MAG TPA: SMP-30/gluconolactonase/LRE family protein [Nocardioidaceae bacterium]